MTTPSKPSKQSPLITIKLERDVVKPENNSSTIVSSKRLTAKQYLKILQAVLKSVEERPFLISDLLAKGIKSLLFEPENTQENASHGEASKKLHKTLPSFQKNAVFFPQKWCKGQTETSKLYYLWDLKTQENATITIGNHTTIKGKRLSESKIELYLEKFSNKNQEHAIEKLAHVICECTRPYAKAIVTISPQKVKDYEALVCYLYAYQKIQTTLADKASQTVPAFFIILEGIGPASEPSSNKIDATIQSILEKDNALKSLYSEDMVTNSVSNIN